MKPDRLTAVFGIKNIAKLYLLALRQCDKPAAVPVKLQPFEHNIYLLLAVGLAKIIACVHLIAFTGEFTAVRSKHDTHVLVALPYGPCNIHTVFISAEYIKYYYVELVLFPHTDKLIAAFIAVYLYILCTFAYAVCQLFCFRRIFVNYRKPHKNTSSHILTHINNSIKPAALQQKFTGRYSPAKCRIISGQQKSPLHFYAFA